ncbi:MAG: adenylyl-sulfate kinase [Thaumarchaeota archaeon 13_1_40CM_4_38_7]|nr:MAG: adenylyl-sulfate kinase [Thaumarchaeota archaeon 13_1_40CM_4_38_7]OLD41817.1 MAG: adenylyl-sulfate kinase [Thaumarchaeota archaeon 13_1_40CM_2_39_4]
MGSQFVIWLTGLSASGKTTISLQLATKLREHDFKVELLDGDAIRNELSADLGFSRQDRREQIRRVVYLCKLLSKNGITCIVSVISPYRDLRNLAREEIRKVSPFIEVFVKCSLESCIKRDPKGLYKKALSGEISNFTGLQDPYEEPLSPDVIVNTDSETVEECVDKIISAIKIREEPVSL